MILSRIYMGDGIFDHYVMKHVGYSIAPGNADENAKSSANYVTKRTGGDRAVAEACLHIMEKFFEPYDHDLPIKSTATLSGEWKAEIEYSGKIKSYTNHGIKTLLGVGPMSNNIIDVTIELADKFNVPLMLIASRRQIDSEHHGGGYVNNWTTENFSKYVHDKDKSKSVVLARDHGGPWQNQLEKSNCLNLDQAMASAKLSYEADIDAGFKILHIDPSIGIDGPVSPLESLSRAFELYEHCWAYAQDRGADIAFEIGTEEQQASSLGTLDELEHQLNSINNF